MNKKVNMGEAFVSPKIRLYVEDKVLSYPLRSNGISRFNGTIGDLHYISIVDSVRRTNTVDVLILDGFIPTVEEMDTLYLLLPLSCLIVHENTRGLYKEVPKHLKMYGKVLS